MPNFRRKSCHQCRASKLACDRKQPQCTRCERRSWPCRYSPVSTTCNTARKPRQQVRVVEPQHVHEPFLHHDTPGHVSEQTAASGPPSLGSTCGSNNLDEPDQPELELARLFNNDVATVDEIQDNFPIGWAAEFSDGSPWTGDAFPNPGNLPSTGPTIDMNPDFVTSIIADTINTSIYRRADFEHSMLADNNLLLRPRKCTNVESSLTSKMILGTILRYPGMVVSGLDLPPFISPPCCGDELRCLQSGSHQCLLQPLVACASIIGMAHTQSPENKAVIWRMIYTEQQKLLHEVS
jgi:hypothetical protein